MRFILFFTLSLLVACAPRDNAPQSDPNGGDKSPTVELKSGDFEFVDKEGEKLQTCREPNHPTWSTVRLHSDLSFVFDKANQFEVVVTKGDFNCVPISSEKQIEIEFGKPTGQKGWDKSGIFYFVKRIELRNTKDVLADKDLLLSLSQKMQMTSEQLSQYLSSPPIMEQLTITYFVYEKQEPTSSLKIKILKVPDDQGKTASVCKNNWTDIRFYPDTISPFETSIKEQRLKVFITDGEMNCYVIGSPVGFVLKEMDSLKPIIEKRPTVEQVVVRLKSDYFNDPVLAIYVSRDMGLSLEDFYSYLSSLKGEKVNATQLNWQEL